MKIPQIKTIWWVRLAPIFLAISAYLVARQLIGMCSLFWLCHSSTPVSDERCQAELARLAKKLNCPNVELRSTDLLCSAGTSGWFRPLIFLPHDYETYTDEELRAVLAHELAHVIQGDFAWRLLVGFYLAMHYCNPLAHWLRARLILEQELLADRIASDVIGCRRSYAKRSLDWRFERTMQNQTFFTQDYCLLLPRTC